MNQIKTILTGVVVLSVLVAGILGVAIVLDLVSVEETKETLVKALSVFAIIGAVSAILIGVMKLNRGE